MSFLLRTAALLCAMLPAIAQAAYFDANDAVSCTGEMDLKVQLSPVNQEGVRELKLENRPLRLGGAAGREGGDAHASQQTPEEFVAYMGRDPFYKLDLNTLRLEAGRENYELRCDFERR